MRAVGLTVNRIVDVLTDIEKILDGIRCRPRIKKKKKKKKKEIGQRGRRGISSKARVTIWTITRRSDENSVTVSVSRSLPCVRRMGKGIR